MIPEDARKVYQKQKYKLVGEHSAAKLCLWTKRSIRTGGKEVCYKQKFYGDLVKSHRCMQCTPANNVCSLNCQFCWRPIELSTGMKIPKEDEPEKIAEGLIDAQRSLLHGLGGIEHDPKYLKEALEPGNVALSLSGEPTCYTQLGDLIREFHKRNMVTFLVTNGTLPERIAALSNLPTQMYVSLCSNSKDMMDIVQKPLMRNAWERLNETLEMFSNLKTRRVVRMTMVKGLNMQEPEKYAKLIEKASPNFVEVKSFMSVGFSRQRLPYSVMPTHDEIKEFAQKVADSLGYKVTNEKRDSRVVLLEKS
jgi:tRNA wybutosine-synthesizing protein 1